MKILLKSYSLFVTRFEMIFQLVLWNFSLLTSISSFEIISHDHCIVFKLGSFLKNSSFSNDVYDELFGHYFVSVNYESADYTVYPDRESIAFFIGKSWIEVYSPLMLFHRCGEKRLTYQLYLNISNALQIFNNVN